MSAASFDSLSSPSSDGQPSITHTVAASGDTILTLNSPNAKFAPWEDDSSPPATNGSPITFRVSSQHIIQASSVFEAALTGLWEEGSKNAEGFYEVSAEDWDAEALRIVLCLIHSRTSNIPRNVTLEMLCKIAVLVDYYNLHEALRFCASLWIEDLRDPLPTTFGRDLILWICVSHIFKDATIFEAVTKRAIEHSPGDIPSLNLPIPEYITGSLNEQRELAMKLLISVLQEAKFKLLDGRVGCSFECRSLNLGALVKFMHDEGFLEAVTEKSYEGRSVTDVITKIREMKSPTKSSYWRCPGFCSFTLTKLIESGLGTATAQIRGLGLGGYPVGTWNWAGFSGVSFGIPR
ncbi:hypothetical protein N656DRAFT_738362 [Canariomyces notabilis]|uniref:BTB domain-containing protein n=1 Tax=Canariomyces notabilis TaxID=2074819 RepID=A0AAN6QFT1_9PEZI|nr:hypothetical protein N656DRAFT_738362 [Canariomyces arenarius]